MVPTLVLKKPGTKQFEASFCQQAVLGRLARAGPLEMIAHPPPGQVIPRRMLPHERAA